MDMQAGAAATELELAAFTEPHARRARIALFAAGALYLLLAALDWSDVADVRALVDAQADGTVQPEIAHLIDANWLLAIASLGAALAVTLLAIAAAKYPSLAFRLAAVVFVAHTGIAVYASHGAVFASWLFWMPAVVLTVGYTAARSAELRRKHRR